jgi:hypothetical protein
LALAILCLTLQMEASLAVVVFRKEFHQVLDLILFFLQG